MVNDINRVMSSYPQIYFACHRRHIRDDERGTVLTVQQASILDHLEAQPRTTLSELASHLGVTVSTASTGVTRLVKNGYVVRLRDEKDNRRVLLALTVAGNKVVQQNSVLDPDDVDQLLRLLEPAQRQTAVDALEALARAAQELLRRREQRRQRVNK